MHLRRGLEVVSSCNFQVRDFAELPLVRREGVFGRHARGDKHGGDGGLQGRHPLSLAFLRLLRVVLRVVPLKGRPADHELRVWVDVQLIGGLEVGSPHILFWLRAVVALVGGHAALFRPIRLRGDRRRRVRGSMNRLPAHPPHLSRLVGMVSALTRALGLRELRVGIDVHLLGRLATLAPGGLRITVLDHSTHLALRGCEARPEPVMAQRALRP
mmetsp:Transcript_34791/g.74218  ORF Transcript_34791/g.74218 Transcript_34791/m.74218 type:complete len:214 (-) Transcript_34791:4-645(-)